jgi:hypothetical protein
MESHFEEVAQIFEIKRTGGAPKANKYTPVVFAHVMLLEIRSWIMVIHMYATRQVDGNTQQQ